LTGLRKRREQEDDVSDREVVWVELRTGVHNKRPSSYSSDCSILVREGVEGRKKRETMVSDVGEGEGGGGPRREKEEKKRLL